MTASLLHHAIETPVGPVVAAAVTRGTDERLALLEFAHGPRLQRETADLERLLDATSVDGTCTLLAEVEQQLAAYFAGSRTEFDLPLEMPGTEFQRRVWHALLDIPFGETRAYGQIAESIGSSGGQRAVGAANGANRIAIIVPCHRVIESGGGLRGYGGGLQRKRALLQLEGARPTEPSLFASARETA